MALSESVVVAFIVNNLGPYHVARLRNLSGFCNLRIIQIYEKSTEYDWENQIGSGIDIETLVSTTAVLPSNRRLKRTLSSTLQRLNPDVVITPGWGSVYSRETVKWCFLHRKRVVILSDSQEIDYDRVWYKEFFKRIFLSFCHAALVAATPHEDYLVKLGFDQKKIWQGYDVVDNLYFSKKSDGARKNATTLRKEFSLPDAYILACARFIPKKNLANLIRAFSKVQEINPTGHNDKVHLVIIGDGPLRPELEDLICAFGLQQLVHLPGFIQYPELPIYYGLSRCYVQASISEQWGLAVNEAMASGVPVLVSEKCGSSVLVDQGVNGYRFPPLDIDALTERMKQIVHSERLISDMGSAGRTKTNYWSLELFSRNTLQAVNCALAD